MPRRVTQGGLRPLSAGEAGAGGVAGRNARSPRGAGRPPLGSRVRRRRRGTSDRARRERGAIGKARDWRPRGAGPAGSPTGQGPAEARPARSLAAPALPTGGERGQGARERVGRGKYGGLGPQSRPTGRTGKAGRAPQAGLGGAQWPPTAQLRAEIEGDKRVARGGRRAAPPRGAPRRARGPLAAAGRAKLKSRGRPEVRSRVRIARAGPGAAGGPPTARAVWVPPLLGQRRPPDTGSARLGARPPQRAPQPGFTCRGRARRARPQPGGAAGTR